MKLKVLFLIPFLLLMGITQAQDIYKIYRLEITPFIGYDLSTSVRIDDIEIDSGDGEYDGYYINELDVKSGPSYGFIVDFSANENFQLEFIWSRLGTELAGYVRSSPNASREKVDLFDMNVDNFHFNLLFQEEMMDEKVWPFFFGGIGGTRFGPSGDISSTTKFSINAGGGVKVFFSDHVGARFQGRWIPTFIQSGEAIWCDWYGWCWAVPTGDYLHQFEFIGGLVLRF